MTRKIGSLYRGFVVSWFFSIHFKGPSWKISFVIPRTSLYHEVLLIEVPLCELKTQNRQQKCFFLIYEMDIPFSEKKKCLSKFGCHGNILSPEISETIHRPGFFVLCGHKGEGGGCLPYLFE